MLWQRFAGVCRCYGYVIVIVVVVACPSNNSELGKGATSEAGKYLSR